MLVSGWLIVQPPESGKQLFLAITYLLGWMADHGRVNHLGIASHPDQLSLAVPPWLDAISGNLRATGEGLVWMTACAVHTASRFQQFTSAVTDGHVIQRDNITNQLSFRDCKKASGLEFDSAI